MDDDIPSAPSASLWKDLLFLLIGCAGLYYGAEWFVGGAKELAMYLGVSERIIGITVLALGTSLPELTTAVIASLKKETDLALGNLLGSNIFNVLSILGITSIVKEIHVSELIVNIDMLWMLGITFIILPFMFTGKYLERWEGAVLLVIYFVYAYTVIM
jgi:cation:H+ antiporter